MATPSLTVPRWVSSESKDGLIKELLRIQTQEAGQVKIISFYYDDRAREHVAWYYPITSSPMVF